MTRGRSSYRSTSARTAGRSSSLTAALERLWRALWNYLRALSLRPRLTHDTPTLRLTESRPRQPPGTISSSTEPVLLEIPPRTYGNPTCLYVSTTARMYVSLVRTTLTPYAVCTSMGWLWTSLPTCAPRSGEKSSDRHYQTAMDGLYSLALHEGQMLSAAFTRTRN